MPKEFGVSNKNVDSRRFRPKLRETPIGKAPRAGVLVTVGVRLAVQDGSASLGPSGSSLATWNKPSPEVPDKLEDEPLDWNLQ